LFSCEIAYCLLAPQVKDAQENLQQTVREHAETCAKLGSHVSNEELLLAVLARMNKSAGPADASPTAQPAVPPATPAPSSRPSAASVGVERPPAPPSDAPEQDIFPAGTFEYRTPSAPAASRSVPAWASASPATAASAKPSASVGTKRAVLDGSSSESDEEDEQEGEEEDDEDGEDGCEEEEEEEDEEKESEEEEEERGASKASLKKKRPAKADFKVKAKSKDQAKERRAKKAKPSSP
jgi:hypothetical protein